MNWQDQPNDHDFFDDDHIKRFLRQHKTGEDNFGRQFLTYIVGNYHNPKILDAAGGSAVNYPVFRSTGFPFEYYLLDRTQKLIDYAKELYGNEIHTVHGYVQEIPFEDNFFDITILRHIGEHLSPDDFHLAIEEAIRVSSKEVVIVFFLEPHDGPEDVLETRSSNIEGHPEITHKWNQYSRSKFISFLRQVAPNAKIKSGEIMTPGAAAVDYIYRVIL